MKLLAIFAIFAVFAYVSASAVPEAVYDGPTYELTPVEDEGDAASTDVGPVRQRRVTCDLLSWQSKWLSFNHSACAARCLAQRRRGGRCRDGVCVCR